MTANDIQGLEPEIKKAAKAVAYQWPGVVENDDIYQMIYLFLLETPGSVKKILGMDDLARYRSVVGIGHQLASKERADYDIYKGSYRYSVQEVKHVLAAGVLVEEFDYWQDVVHDLIEGLITLTNRTPQYVDAILGRYADFEVPQTSTGKTSLKRGLTALTNEMNKSHRRNFSERDDGPGTRKAMSNSRAQSFTAVEYQGYLNEGRN